MKSTTMAKGPDPDWTKLNAYVDGELDRMEAAAVAGAAAEDAGIAAQIATLAKLKASVTSAIHIGEIPPFPATARRSPSALMRIAACAATMAILIAGLVFWRSPNPEPWLSGAVAAHQAWRAATAADASTEQVLLRIDATMPAHSLDLSAADLTLIHAATGPQVGGTATAFLGYRGPHGCRVGLWIGPPQANVSETPGSFDSAGALVRAWRDNRTGYALVSQGIDPARLDRLADAVARLTDPRHSLDSIRLALQEASRAGRPCRI